VRKKKRERERENDLMYSECSRQKFVVVISEVRAQLSDGKGKRMGMGCINGSGRGRKRGGGI